MLNKRCRRENVFENVLSILNPGVCKKNSSTTISFSFLGYNLTSNNRMICDYKGFVYRLSSLKCLTALSSIELCECHGIESSERVMLSAHWTEGRSALWCSDEPTQRAAV